MPTIAVVSQKGGSGKTTLAVHLATAAHQAGRVALILDGDPQASSSRWSTWRQGAAPEVVATGAPGQVAERLARALEIGAELVVIDTPPAADALASAAARVADLVLVPSRPRAFDLAAIQTTADLVRATGRPGHVVFIGGPPRGGRLLYAEAGDLVRAFGLEVAPVVLSDRATFHRAVAAGSTAGELEPGGKAAAEVAALWAWVCQQPGMTAPKHAIVKSRKRRV